MGRFRKSIFTAASPNTQFNDALLSLRVLLNPFLYRKNKFNEKFKEDLSKYIKVDNISLVDSGRTALLTILKALDLKEGDEVIMPSFTCVVVANAVSWSGATPIYLDTNKVDFNADYSSLDSKITNKTKAIVVQHTFGKRVDIKGIRDSIKNYNRKLFIIEDFAHDIHRDINPQGDIAFSTFGIEKVMSTVRGGMIFTNDKAFHDSIEKVIESYNDFPIKRVIISLLNPIFWFFAIPLHSVGIGRFTVGAMIRGIWRKLGFLGIMVEEKENHALKPDWFPAKMSPALSRLGILQLKKLDFYNSHRSEIAKIYNDQLISISDSSEFDNDRVYLRYPILLNSREDWLKVWNLSRSLRVTLGNWFSSPLYGAGVDEKTYKKLCYVPATTEVTVKKTNLVLNLPTSINIDKKELAN
ncbi:MAG: aminotransferase class I/II-fold pyridoxal phosphate-dependent enzyme [Candidatus Dojkabacteria bacterium]|nr:aminotransferase class I/II-fold pyridoxal phosphate-dependent enzyme [Candidatus Dojkabacteria bacterium]